MPRKVAVAILLTMLAMAGCATGPFADGRTDETLRAEAEAAYHEQRPQAEALYQRLTASPQARAEDWFRLGNLYADKNELEPAAAAYREALKRDPQLARARHNLGMTYLQLGVESILAARRGLPDVDPEAAGSMRWLACVMELFMGFPDPATCRDIPDQER